MRFVKEHLLGIVLGVVAYELYYRQNKKGPAGG